MFVAIGVGTGLIVIVALVSMALVLVCVQRKKQDHLESQVKNFLRFSGNNIISTPFCVCVCVQFFVVVFYHKTATCWVGDSDLRKI